MDVAPLRAPKTPKGHRVAKARESKVVEDEKKAVFIRGPTCSDKVRSALLDFCALKKPHGKMLTKKNPVRPFEDAGSIEFLAKANDSACFVFGSHSKKRPHSLIFGRTFDDQILDMLEFQMDDNTFRSMQSFAGDRTSTSRVGAKPIFCFVGEAFETSAQLGTFRSLILDMFRGETLRKINLAALDRVFVVTAAQHPTDMDKKVVYFRHYNVLRKRSGTRIPRVELEEVGPRMDLTYNRYVEAPTEVRKEAMRIPKMLIPNKEKNVEEGLMGQTLGRVHMQKQDLRELALAKLKGLGKGKRKRAMDDDGSDSRSEAAAADAADTASSSSSVPAGGLGLARSGPRKLRDSGRSGIENLTEHRDRSMIQSSKKQKKLPKAYESSFTSE